MEFGARSKPRLRASNQSNNKTSDELYPHRIQLYSTAPTDNISLQEFEELAVERLKGQLLFPLHKFSELNCKLHLF